VGQVLGPTLLSLAVVKNGLIALTFAFMFLAARQIMPTPTAWLAALGLIWLPGVGWSLMRDQTHTVMLNAAIAATWWALLRQIRAPSPMGFALLGVLMAWGVLSKYSYVLVAAAAVLAALSLPQPQREHAAQAAAARHGVAPAGPGQRAGRPAGVRGAGRAALAADGALGLRPALAHAARGMLFTNPAGSVRCGSG
jgi:hypothetical protein